MHVNGSKPNAVRRIRRRVWLVRLARSAAWKLPWVVAFVGVTLRASAIASRLQLTLPWFVLFHL